MGNLCIGRLDNGGGPVGDLPSQILDFGFVATDLHLPVSWVALNNESFVLVVLRIDHQHVLFFAADSFRLQKGNVIERRHLFPFHNQLLLLVHLGIF